MKMEVSIVMGVPKNGWFVRDNPIKVDELGVALFEETTKYPVAQQSWLSDSPGCSYAE